MTLDSNSDDAVKAKIIKGLLKKEMTRSRLLRLLGAKVNAARLTALLDELCADQTVGMRRLRSGELGCHGWKSFAWGLWDDPNQVADRAKKEEERRQGEEAARWWEEERQRKKARKRWKEYIDELPSLIDPDDVDDLIDVLLARLRARPRRLTNHRLWKHSRSLF